MKRAGEVLKEFEDYLAPVLGLKPGERAVYMHALRHSRLEDRRGVVFALPDLARGVGLKPSATRLHLYSLARKGCVVVNCPRKKYVIEVRLPEEVVRELSPRNWARLMRTTVRASKNPELREAILERERGRCFYCLERLTRSTLWFDHVVPIARGGWPSEDNVVACCERCNRWKGTRTAESLLRRLCQAGILTRAQVNGRKWALRRILAEWKRERIEDGA